MDSQYQQLITRRPRPEMEDDSWLITFADMAVLLMCFFILLFSISSPDMEQVKIIAQGLRAKGFYSDVAPLEDPYQKLKKELALSLGASGYDKQVAVSDSKHGVEVELASSAFFVYGTAKFSDKALPMLQMISAQIMPLANKDVIIQIEGHTDDAPISTPQFPSNWELSAARAANLVRYLIAQGFPANKLRAVGLADTQPKAPNHDSAGNPIPANQDLNRRVVIKLMRGDDN
jgi:chemotaxis protein MotB